MTVEELKVQFTANIADFKAKMQQMKKEISDTSQISSNMSKAIDKGMKSSSDKAQKLARDLQSLGGKLNAETEKIKESYSNIDSYSVKMDKLKSTYKTQTEEITRQQAKVTSLGGTYDKINAALKQFGTKIPLSEQLAEADRNANLIDEKIREIQGAIDSAKKTDKLIFVGNELVSIDEAKNKIQELIISQEEAAQKAFEIDRAISSIGKENIKFASNEGIKELKGEVSSARKELSSMQSQANATNSEMSRTAAQVANEYKKIKSSVPKLDKLKSDIADTQAKLKKATSFSEKFSQTFKKAQSAISAVGSGIRKIPSLLKSLGNNAKQSAGHVSKIPASLKKIAAAAVGLQLIKSIFGRLKSIVSNYISQNDKLNARVEGMKNAFGQLLAPAIEIVVSAFEKLMPYLLAIGNAIVEVLSSLSIFSGLKNTSSAIDGVTDSTNALSKAQSELFGFDKITKQDDNKNKTPPTNYKAADIGSIDEIISKITKSINDALGSIDWDTVKSKAVSFAKDASEAFNQFFNGVDWNLAGKTVGEGLNTITSTINTFVDNTDWGNLGKGITNALNESVKTINWDDLGKTFSAKWKVLTEVLKPIIEGFDFRNLGSGIGTAINSWFDNISWGDVSGNISGAIAGAFTTIASTLETIDWQDLAKKAEDFVKGIDWSGMASALFESIGAALGGLSAFIWTLISDAISNIGSYFSGKIEEAGGNVVSGILKGIGDALVNVGTWIKEHIFQPFIDGFKNAFGIHSPSTVMEEQGGYLIDGLKNGVSGIWDKVKGKFEEFLQSVRDWFETSKIGELLSDFTSGIKDVSFKIATAFSSGAEKIINWFVEKFGKKDKAEVSATVKGEGQDSSSNPLSKWKSTVWDKITNRSATISGKGKDADSSPLSTWMKDKWNKVASRTAVISGQGKDAKESPLSKWKVNTWDKLKNKPVKVTASAGEDNKKSFSDYFGSFLLFDKKTSKVTATASEASSFGSSKKKFDDWESKTISITASLKDGITTALKNMVKGIVDMLNGLIDMINEALPGTPIKTEVQVPKWAMAATGGIVDRATPIIAGEAGKEAIMPLENNTGWIDSLASRISSNIEAGAISSGTTAKTVVIPVYIGSRKVSETVIEDINVITATTGMCPIKV